MRTVMFITSRGRCSGPYWESDCCLGICSAATDRCAQRVSFLSWAGKTCKRRIAMSDTMVSATVAQKWTNLVASCCPEVKRASWHAAPDEIAITAWFKPTDDEVGQAPEVVEIVASMETVDDYAYASDVAQFRADVKLVEFVTRRYRHSTREHGRADPESRGGAFWPITSMSLGLHSHRS